MASVLILSTASCNMIFKAIFSNYINPMGLIVNVFHFPFPHFPEKGVASAGNLGVSLLMYLSQLAYQSISP